MLQLPSNCHDMSNFPPSLDIWLEFSDGAVKRKRHNWTRNRLSDWQIKKSILSRNFIATNKYSK